MFSDLRLEFVYPFWLFLILPLFLLLFLRKKEGASGSITFSSVSFLKPFGKHPGGRVGLFSLLLLIAGMSAGIIALARPQLINEKDYTSSSGIDIVIAFDISESMETEDMALYQRRVNRLTVAKAVLSEFIDWRPNDRMGLVAFAARPKMYSPITLDHDIVKSQIALLNPKVIEARGTAIGSAIAAAATRLEDRKDTKSKIIILVTDGASNSGELTPLQAAKLAAKLGIKIYTIAIGTEGGRLSSLANPKQEFDEETLKEIAKVTHGAHFRAKNTQSFIDAFNSIDKLEKSEAKHYIVRREEDIFPYCIGLCALLVFSGLLLEILRPRPAP